MSLHFRFLSGLFEGLSLTAAGESFLLFAGSLGTSGDTFLVLSVEDFSSGFSADGLSSVDGSSSTALSEGSQDLPTESPFKDASVSSAFDWLSSSGLVASWFSVAFSAVASTTASFGDFPEASSWSDDFSAAFRGEFLAELLLPLVFFSTLLLLEASFDFRLLPRAGFLVTSGALSSEFVLSSSPGSLETASTSLSCDDFETDDFSARFDLENVAIEQLGNGFDIRHPGP